MSTPTKPISVPQEKYYLLKLQHEKDIRRVSIVQDEISFQGLLRTIKSLFKEIPNGHWLNLSLQYMDREGDWCSITNDNELLDSIHYHQPPLLKIRLSFAANECVGQKALASQFPDGSYPFATVLSVQDKISPRDFNKARNAMETHLQEIKNGRTSRPHVLLSGESIDPVCFKKAKLLLNGFIETNPRAFKKPSPLAVPTGASKQAAPRRAQPVRPTAHVSASSSKAATKPTKPTTNNTNCGEKPASVYPGLGAIAFENCRRVVAPYATRHVRLQCTPALETVSAYAAMYLGDKCPTKNWNQTGKSMDLIETPCIEYMSYFEAPQKLFSCKKPASKPVQSTCVPTESAILELAPVASSRASASKQLDARGIVHRCEVRQDQEQWYMLALYRLGFMDGQLNRVALEKMHYNLAAAIEFLLGAH